MSGINLRSPKFESVKFAAPSPGLDRGQMYKQGSLIGVIFEDTATGDDAVLCYKAEKIVVPKKTGTGFSLAIGDKVYYDSTNKRVTSATTGNTLCGRVLVAAGINDATVEIVLNGDVAA